MPMAEAGRVDVEEMEHALLLGDTTEDAFGHRRAADIAETDEEKPVSCHARSNGMRPAAMQDRPARASPRLHDPRADPIFGSRASLVARLRTMVAWNEEIGRAH